MDIFTSKGNIRQFDNVKLPEMKDALGGVPEGAFTFLVEPSNNKLDSHYTRMGNDTLTNFAMALQQGVSLLDSHNGDKLGIGYSFFSYKEDVPEGDEVISRVFGYFYIPPGIRLGDYSYQTTDDYINAIRKRIVRDVSIRYTGGEVVCDVCGENVWGNTECPHVPGMEVEGENGVFVATATIVGAGLAETSLVYKGSTPDAMIKKVQRMHSSGKLNKSQVLQLENRHQTRFYKMSVYDTKRKNGMKEKGSDEDEARGALSDLLKRHLDDSINEENPRASLVSSLAERIGCSVATVNNDFAGRTPCIPQGRLEVYANQLGVGLNTLIRAGEADGCSYRKDNGMTTEKLLAKLMNERGIEIIDDCPSKTLDALLVVKGEAGELKESLEAAETRVVELEKEVQSLSELIASQERLVELGKAYKKDLIEESLAEGVRAVGLDFKRDMYEKILSTLSIEQIKEMRSDWKRIGDENYPPGRRTEDGNGQKEKPGIPPHIARTLYNLGGQ